MKTAILLDFDDTIWDTKTYKKERDEFYNREFDAQFLQKFKNYETDYARRKIKIFNLREILTAREITKTNEHLREIAPNLIYPDLVRFMSKLALVEMLTPQILTFGEKELQANKIAAAGIDLPVIHVEVDNKTEIIKSWWRENFYEINGEKFREIVLIDDRLKNFGGFPNLANACGFLLNRTENSREIDEKNLAKNVKIVKSFDEIVL